MNIINAKVLVPKNQLEGNVLEKLERYARVCYKSEDKMSEGATDSFLSSVLTRGHESVIEHEKITVMFIIDRGVSHEFVRHRIGSFSQESTRYCNYGKDKFGQEITVIEPVFFRGRAEYAVWEETCKRAEEGYFQLLDMGATPQEARSVLPNSLKTEIVITFNIREWRHFLSLRAAKNAHPQSREVAIPLLKLFKEKLPVLFADIPYDESFLPKDYAKIQLTDDLFF